MVLQQVHLGFQRLKTLKEINVEKALEDKESVFYHYKKLIELRKTYDVITEGEYAILDKK